MAEKVIKNNQSLLPFFGERLSFVRGLDPLGLQNTSEATYAMLLPGLNNVTGRIRYYSFYCWLLDEYSKISGSTNPKEQQQFIRRAEYTIALASQYFENIAFSIPGSLYASNQIRRDLSVIHDLQAGTYKSDGSTAETYWKYPSGAFGQYYLGSLRDIGIVSSRENQQNIFVRTNNKNNNYVSGEALAYAFDANIKPETKKFFFECILNGRISEAQLTELLPDLNLSIIPPDTEEADLLIKMLLHKDYPLYIEEEPRAHRYVTIKHLLTFLSAGVADFNDRLFIYDCYQKKGRLDIEPDPTLTGWYYFQFNEYWQYAHTAMLNGALTYLESTAGPNWIPLKPFIENLTGIVISIFEDQGITTTPTDTVEHVLQFLQPDENYFYRIISENEGSVKIAHAFLLIFSLYLNQQHEIIRLREYSASNDLGKDGEGASYFLSEFPTKKFALIKDFIFEYIYKHVIYRHQYVAFRKIRGGVQSTQKFIIEEYHIRYLGNFEPAYSAPRIGNLMGFLKDLSIVTAENTLSDRGISLLNNVDNGNY
jgi:hypothetical protein